MDDHTPAQRTSRLGRRPPPVADRLRRILSGLTGEARVEYLTGLSQGGWLEPPTPDWADEIPSQVFVGVLRDGSVLSQGPADADGLRDVRVHRSPAVYEIVAPPGPAVPGQEYAGPPEETYGPTLRL